MGTGANPFRGFYCPAGNTNQADLLCHCLSLNPRDVELIPVARGVMVSYETVRKWGLRFGRP
jgi:putative transposase